MVEHGFDIVSGSSLTVQFRVGWYRRWWVASRIERDDSIPPVAEEVHLTGVTTTIAGELVYKDYAAFVTKPMLDVQITACSAGESPGSEERRREAHGA